MITTNGSLLPKQCELLCRTPCVHKISISLHSFEGNEGTDDLSHYLDNCISFAKQAGQSGKHCALRLWNLDGQTTRGANTENDRILRTLQEHFPKPWTPNPHGSTLAPKIYLEWGEKFEWPDLQAQEENRPLFCYGLRDQIGVLWDGTVVPCCLDHEGDIALGNLFRDALGDILAGDRAKAIYEGFRGGIAVEELCRKCGYARRFGV